MMCDGSGKLFREVMAGLGKGGIVVSCGIPDSRVIDYGLAAVRAEGDRPSLP
jgi:hypothetical protein